MPTHCSPASQSAKAPAERIRQVAGADPYVRLRLDDAAVGEVLIDSSGHAGCAVAWTTVRPSGQRWAVGCGEEASAIALLLERLHGHERVDGVTVPADAFGALPGHLTSPDPGHWSLWELDRLTSPEPGSAVTLDPSDPRIRELLTYSPSAHVFPGDRQAHWAGVEEDGSLLSVAAEVREPNGYAHVVSVCTHPAVRGRRLAGAAIGHLVQRARSTGCTGVMLEMYAANEPGRQAYRRIGFREVGQYRSGLIDRTLPNGPLPTRPLPSSG